MGILSTGTVTLVDLTDQRPVQFYLETQGSKVQSKGGDGKYQPDYTETPITIYPKLFFGNDNESERITQNIISYTINDVTVSASNTIGYKNDRNCIINKNIPSTDRTQLIEATLITTNLKDPKTGVSINGGEPLKASIELVLNISGTRIESITQYYAVNNSKTDAPSGNDWKTDYKQTVGLSPTNKYLWSYTETTYDDDSIASTSTPPAIIGVYGDSGTGISEVKSYYKASPLDGSSDNKEIRPGADPTDDTGDWKITPSAAVLNSTNKYLWNYEKTVYTYGDPTYTEPKIIGNYASDGADGKPAASLEVYANRLAFDKQNSDDITITADFRVGGSIVDTGVTYRWTRVPSKDSFNSTDKTVTVKRDDVDGLTTFTCTVSYTDYDDFSDSVTINDYTDPIVSEIISSNGTQFKNSNIETDLTCRLFDSDSEVDPYVDGKAIEEYAYGYIWLKSANNTIASNPWRSITYPCICKDTNGNYSIAKNETEASGKEKFVSGKKISITKTDIESKATFYCEVIKL